MSRQALLVQQQDNPGPPLKRALSERGYTVTQPLTGTAAVAFAQHHQPDLILLAGSLPDLSAADLCRTLKLQRSTNLLPIVALQERVLAESILPIPTPQPSLALQVEPEATLIAPFSSTELSRALRRAASAHARHLADGTLAEIRFLLPSDADHLEELIHLLGPWLSGCGLSAYSVQQMSLAVREIVANSIEWGHGCQRERLVSVVSRLDEEKVTVLVRDTGAGFDPSNLPHAARPGDPLSHLKVRAERKLRDGGFGILMASGLVDHLCYSDTGNEAQLTRFLPARPRRGRSSKIEDRGSRIEDRAIPSPILDPRSSILD
jgi:CheY-like chemotaxis protein/anti-sigma regulatory factor (Ser/Thr protein kinase)